MSNYHSQTYQYEEKKVRVGLSLTPTAINLLNQIAKKLKLSKSELIENFMRGILKLIHVNVNSDTVLEITENDNHNFQIQQISSAINEQFNRMELLENQLQEKDNLLRQNQHLLQEKEELILELKQQLNLQNQQKQTQEVKTFAIEQELTKQSHLVDELQHQVKYYHNLQRQFDEKSLLVIYLQKQLKNIQKNKHNYEDQVKQCQQELHQKNEEIEALRKSLYHQQFSLEDRHKNYEKLEILTKQQLTEIATLKQQINQLQLNLQGKINSELALMEQVKQQQQELDKIQTELTKIKSILSTNQFNYDNFQQQHQEQIKQIWKLEKTIEYQKEILQQEGVSNILLKEIIDTQTEQIENLQGKIAQLQSLANFGETQLNKWRSRNFNG